MTDAVDPGDLDAVVRMAATEAGNQGALGQQAVAAVARNRSSITGQSLRDVVNAPGQFEGMTTPLASSLSPADPLYQAVASHVLPVLTGEAPDPTNGATHFINPVLQVADGRAIPKWAQGGDGQRIGAHVFFNRGGELQPSADATPSADAIMKAYGWGGQGNPSAPAPNGVPAGAPPAVASGAQSGFGTLVTDGKPNAAQQATVDQLRASGQWDDSQPAASPLRPAVVMDPSVKIDPSWSYIDQSGQYHPGGQNTDTPSADDISKAYGWAGAGNVSAPAAQAAPAQPEGLGATIWNGVKGLAGEFGHDYEARVQPALNALGQDISGAAAGTPQDAFAAAAPLGLTPRAVKFLGDAANYLTAPIMAAGDTVVGRPVSSAAKMAGANVDPQTVTNVASVAVPLAEGVTAAGAVARAAEGAGMSVPGYEAMTAARDAGTATLQQSAAAAAKAAQPPGPLQNALMPVTNAAKAVISVPGNVLAPFVAKLSEDSAQTQAGKIIAANATDLPAVRATLANGTDQLVPGSVPTTFQQTGDVGLGSMERAVATRNPDAFATVRGDQNAARVSALSGIQTGADPADVATALKANFAALDAQHSADVNTALQAAQAKAAAIGGTLTPEAYGASIRDAVTTAEDAARQREGSLWQAVDPDGTLTGNATATKQAATDIASSVPTTAKPMSGEEGAIFSTAANLPHVAPLSDLIALRSRVSTEMRNELVSNGRTPTYGRLSQLRGAIEGNLSSTISDQVAKDDAAVQSGTLAPDQAMAARYQSVVDNWQQERAAARTGIGGSNPTNPGVGTASVPSAGGAAVSTGGGSGGVAGNPGIPAGPIGPTVDADAVARLAVANQATKDRAATFGAKPVSTVTASAGVKGTFRLPDGSVPNKFFHPGPTGYTDMQALQQAAPAGVQTVQDFAASSLRRAAMQDDGTLDPDKFARWSAQHAHAVRALPPEMQQQFATAAGASDALADAATARVAALKNAQGGAVGKVLNLPAGQPVGPVVGQILEGRTGQSDMAALAKATAGNPDARAGLRQAVVDHILHKYVGNTEAGTSGIDVIRSDQFQTFVKKNRGGLSQVFSPQEVSNIEAIGADIHRANRSQTALKLPGQSNTAQDAVGIAKHGAGGFVANRATDLLGVLLGHHLHIGGGIGEAIGLGAAETLNGLRQAGINRIDDLVTKGMLDPDIARVLLSKVGKPTPALITGRLKALSRALQIGGVASAAQPSQTVPQAPANALMQAAN